MATDGKPVFELHIAPLFRLLDKLHMARLSQEKRINLADYQEIRDKHAKILTMLESTGNFMPTSDTGGPWPKEWIALFARWGKTGFGRLAKPQANGLQLNMIAADRFELTCNVVAPGPASAAWFDIIAATPDEQVYELVMREDISAGQQPTTLDVEERIRGPLNVADIVVRVAGTDEHLAIPMS